MCMRSCVLGVGLLLLAACAQTPRVTKVASLSSATGKAEGSGALSGIGLYYVLPKTIIHLSLPVTVKFTPDKGKAQQEAKSRGDAATPADKDAVVKAGGKSGAKKQNLPERAVLSFTGAAITAEGLPDPDQIYHIELSRQAAADFGISANRTESGLINSIGMSAVDRKADIAKQFIRYGAYIGSAWVSGGLTATLPTMDEDGTSAAKQAISTQPMEDPNEKSALEASLDGSNHFPGGVVLRLKPEAQQAKGKGAAGKDTAAAEKPAKETTVQDVKEIKRQLLFGELLPTADGTGIKARLDGLDAYAKELSGDSDIKEVAQPITANYKLAFDIDPLMEADNAAKAEESGTAQAAAKATMTAGTADAAKKDDKPKTLKIPLLYFGKHNGIIWCPSSPYDVVMSHVKANNKHLVGTPEFNKLLQKAYEEWFTDEKTEALRKNFLIASIAPVDSVGSVLKTMGVGNPKGDVGYYYREPGMVRVTLSMGEKIVATALVPVAQYGTILALPRSYGGKALDESILFYYNTGAIKSLAINSTARTAKDSKDYYASMAEILAAAQKIKAAQEAAATQASTPSTTSQ